MHFVNICDSREQINLRSCVREVGNTGSLGIGMIAAGRGNVSHDKSENRHITAELSRCCVRGFVTIPPSSVQICHAHVVCQSLP